MMSELSPRPFLPAIGWCHDEDTRDNVVARRNVLAGIWAGKLLGLPEVRLAAYAAEVHQADNAVQGDQDVVAKLTADLNRAGVAISQADVRAKLNGFSKQAWAQVISTD